MGGTDLALSTLEKIKAERPLAGSQSTFEADREADCLGQRIGILVVTYNAVTTISKVLQRIPVNVWRNVEEVVIFDDASQDATYELAVGLKTINENSKLHVLKHEKNLGYGGNQKAGYQYFIEKGFDVVVLLHGDGQYAPEILARMYHPLIAGKADAVFGSRMMKDYGGPLKGGMPLYKYLGNKILTHFENSSLGMHLTEFHSGYRAYSLHALKQIDFSKMTNDFHFDTEIIIKLNHQGFQIHEVPIPTYYGDEICHVNGMKYAWDVARAVGRYKKTRQSLAKFPEFEEYFVHYPIKTSPHSSHTFVKDAVGTGQDVLDIGCGEGFLDNEFKEAGNRIWGIDFIPHAKFSSVMEGYAQADLNSGLLPYPTMLEGRQFDKILLMDVLEHLQSPENMLRDCKPLLRQNGILLVSVPNVVNISVRLLIMLGKFEYTDRGILDRTHVHFYTRASSRKMLEDAGYEVIKQKMTIIPAELAMEMSENNPLVKLVQYMLIVFTAVLPGLFGYQSFLLARKRSSQA
jgi:glycosyltransferase involved in cell wall biosynthesis/ubiquinone/menaquinone biosynthesis C-methylase UbiE